jgi:hypothetical protein
LYHARQPPCIMRVSSIEAARQQDVGRKLGWDHLRHPIAKAWQVDICEHAFATAQNPRPQYVRTGRQRLGRARLEGLVGRQSPISRADFYPHPPSPGANRDGGGTIFHFITDGIEAALAQDKAAAGDLVKIGGGVSTVRQYLLAGTIDELHLALSPVG